MRINIGKEELKETDVIKLHNEITSTATNLLNLAINLKQTPKVIGIRNTISNLVRKQKQTVVKFKIGSNKADQMELISCEAILEDIIDGLITLSEDLMAIAESEVE